MEQMKMNLEKKYRHNDYRHIMQIRVAEEEAPKDDEKEDDGYYVVEGKAVTFDEETTLFRQDGIDYKEKILREAFDNTNMDDVFLKFNHESSVMGVARTKNKTLDIDVRDDGVYIKAKLSKKIRGAVELYEAIKEGLIDKMSFAFTISDEEYDEKAHLWTVRGIDKLYDVAAVEIPTYENTYIYARRFDDVEALSAKVEALEVEQKRNILKEMLKDI